MLTDTEKRPGSFQHCWHRSLRGVVLVMLAAGLWAAGPATAAAVPGGATVFVQSAKSAKLGGGRLVLGGVSGRVSWATNSGRAGVISVRRLHRRLIRPGKPATGTLHIAGRRGGQELAFRLSRPRYNPTRDTVAYRAQLLAKRRAAQAVGFRRPRRFGAASLSIIPHPALMGTSEQGGPTCSVTIDNQTDSDLTANPSTDFQLIGTWDPAPPSLIKVTAETHPPRPPTWAAVGPVGGRCLNAGTFTMPGEGNVTFSIDSADGYKPYCEAVGFQAAYDCRVYSQSGGNVVFWLVGPE
jgi:hypothetical protein